SPLVGRTVESVRLRETYGIDVLAIERRHNWRVEIVRPTHEIVRPTGKTAFQHGDILLVDRFDPDGDLGELLGQFALTKLPLTEPFFLVGSGDLGMAEVRVGPDSPVVSQTVRGARVRTDYGLTVLGFRRAGAARPYGHLDEPLRVGDALLVFGSWKQIDALTHASDDLILLRLPVQRGAVLSAAR